MHSMWALRIGRPEAGRTGARAFLQHAARALQKRGTRVPGAGAGITDDGAPGEKLRA